MHLVCLSVCMSVRTSNSKTIAHIFLFCFKYKKYYPLARSFSKMIQIRMRIWTQECISGFFTIGRYDNICHQSTPWRHLWVGCDGSEWKRMGREGRRSEDRGKWGEFDRWTEKQMNGWEWMNDWLDEFMTEWMSCIWVDTETEIYYISGTCWEQMEVWRRMDVMLGKVNRNRKWST